MDAIFSRLGGMVANFFKEEVVMLWGVTQEVPDLERKMRMIQDVLEDNESRRIPDKSIRRWLMELKDILYDADDIIDRCRIEDRRRDRLLENRTPVASTSAAATTAWVRCLLPVYSCFTEVAFRHEIGSRIKNIHVRLEKISKQRSDFQLTPTARDDRVEVSEVSRQTSPLEEPDVVGLKIEQDTSKLVELLRREEEGNRLISAIVGMGGIGKTTLARRIFNHTTITSVFKIKIWVCVSKDFDELKLLREIISCADGCHVDAQTTRSQLELVLNQTVNQKKIFLVLDDVWKEEIWEDLLRIPLQSCATGSRILITTRHDSVAQLMGAIHRHRVDLLPSEDGWSLLCKKAFSTGVEKEEEIQEFKEIGIKIVGKCDGLPLAIKTIGGVLKTKKKKAEWEKILSSSVWSITGLPEGINKALYLSYEDLPYLLKQCFLYCSLFPEDYMFSRFSIIDQWIAEGLVGDQEGLTMDEKAKGIYHDLINRNLLQAHPHSANQSECTMHDLLRSLAQFLSQDENVSVDSQGLNVMTTFSKPRRLSFANAKATSIPILYESLRTLLAYNSSLRDIHIDLPNKVMHLRVLDISYTRVECLPKSVGNLFHLRYLNLSGTLIREIPETVGDLISLQFLILQRCEHLHNLPPSITRLYNLRKLRLSGTPVSCVPSGIGRLEKLQTLEGFVVSGVDSDAGGCSLGELNSLSNIKILSIYKLERTLPASYETKGGPPLNNMRLLRELKLSCKSRDAAYEDPYTEDEQVRIKEVFEELCDPPPNLVSLIVENFFGKEYPSWMMKPIAFLPDLESLYLINCHNCQQLPCLAPLRQLNYVKIKGANAVVTIGLEFFGRVGIHSSSCPKLRFLQISEMPAWEEWCGVEDGALPSLCQLYLFMCPKLRSLPDGLRYATALTTLIIDRAVSLKNIENLTSVKDLRVNKCPNLERVSNLLAIEKLLVSMCPSLKEVDQSSLGVVRHLRLYDYSMESLPEWLQGQLLQQQYLQLLEIGCSPMLLMKLSIGEDGSYWPMIQHIHHVQAFTWDKSKYFSYSKTPFSITTNINDG